jgi:hypothetical protein
LRLNPKTILEILVFSAHNRIFSDGRFPVSLTRSAERSIRQNRSQRL